MYYCRECHRPLSPAEARSYDENQREFEDFERAISACIPDGLEDGEIPDHPPRDAEGFMDAEKGEIAIPTAWLQPLCDRCNFIGTLAWVLYEWDGSFASGLMMAYAEGTMGCHQSPVMALSWAYVLQQWYRPEADREDYPDYREAVHLEATLPATLTEAERRAAHALAEEVYDIARAHGAVWVPNPNQAYLKIFQGFLEGGDERDEAV